MGPVVNNIDTNTIHCCAHQSSFIYSQKANPCWCKLFFLYIKGNIHTYLDKVYSTALQVAILRGMHNLRDDVHNPGHADTPTQSGGKMIPSVNIDITRKICNLEGKS